MTLNKTTNEELKEAAVWIMTALSARRKLRGVALHKAIICLQSVIDRQGLDKP